MNMKLQRTLTTSNDALKAISLSAAAKVTIAVVAIMGSILPSSRLGSNTRCYIAASKSCTESQRLYIDAARSM